MKITILKSLVLAASLTAMPAMAATPDGWITTQTKLSLWTTAGVRSGSVHVDTNDGIVTLHGKVPTPEQKALAEKTVRDVTGVKAVKSLLQVVPASQEKRVAHSDKDTQAAAEKALKADVALKDSKISVKSVDKGLVLLTGDAHTFSDHLRAVLIVDRLPGVQRVASEVKGPDGFGNDDRVIFLNHPSVKAVAEGKFAQARSSATDLRISAAVKLRLLTAAQLPSTEISVDTEDGIVTLFGMVPTAAVKNSAAVETGKVVGVNRVMNHLEVVPSSQKEMVEAKDDDIARDLALAFKDRPEFKKIDSAVKNGIVRLTGTVGSGWDEVNAVRVTRKVAGVRAVEDQLKLDTKAFTETTRRD